MDILINTSQNHRAVAEVIQQTWHKQLGVDAQHPQPGIQGVPRLAAHAQLRTSRAAWIGDYPDPFTFLGLFVTGNGNNDTGCANPEYDRLIAASHTAPTDAERLEDFQQAESVLLDDAPVAPIYFYTNVYLLQPSVKGWYNNVQDRHMPQFIYLEETAATEFKKLPLAAAPR